MTQGLTEQIYETDKIMANTMRLINADAQISADNKTAIAEFLDGKEAEGLSPNRLIILAASLRRTARLTTASFKQFTEQDARSLIKSLERAPYKDWTKVTTKKVFKQICRFNKLPSNVYGEWLKVSKPPNTLRKEDLLTSEEINRLVAAAPNDMWRCLLAILAETGARPSEILSLTIRQVIQNGTHFKLFCSGKMAKKQGERPVFIIKNYALLQSWLGQHPAKAKADAPLFFVKDLQPITIILLGRTIKRTAARAMKEAMPMVKKAMAMVKQLAIVSSFIPTKLTSCPNPSPGLTAVIKVASKTWLHLDAVSIVIRRAGNVNSG